ncbi:natural killer cells antigen CD94-like isoform X2 [Puntigrus tetrazona]|nr:natural killer cells antigen CD94-like isoform X2 [Puntigrus tetrazona]
MDSIYENTDYMPSMTAVDIGCSLYSGFSFQKQEQERGVASVKRTKVLLTLLGFSLVFALGGVCALGVLLARARQELKNNYTTVPSLRVDEGHLCLEGWIACRGKLYLFSSDELNWSSSRDICVSKGGDLVIVTNQTEQDFLFSKIKETHWIGLNDLEIEGRWVWVNNQTLEETGVQFWFRDGPREPDNWRKQDPSGENCASLGDSNGNLQYWFDSSCKKKKRFICERKNVFTSIKGSN